VQRQNVGGGLHIEGAPDTHNTESLIAIQILDGVANAIFGVVSILVLADRTRATGRFNLVQNSLATAVGLGAALSTTFGGRLIQHFSCRISSLSLGAIAALAFLLLWTTIPETLPERNEPGSDRRKPFRDWPGIERRLMLASISQALSFSRETLQRTSGLCLAMVCTSTSLCCIESDFRHAWL
jgi:MFS family permease